MKEPSLAETCPAVQLASQQSYHPPVQRVEPCFICRRTTSTSVLCRFSSFLVCASWPDDRLPLHSSVPSHLHIIALALLAYRNAEDNMGLCQTPPRTSPSRVNRAFWAACAESHLICSQVHADALLHPRTWHCRLGVEQRAKVCACMQRVGDSGQGPGPRQSWCVGEHAAVGAGWCAGQQRGCGVLNMPLMSFLGQLKLWGELISKQARERRPYSPLFSQCGLWRSLFLVCMTLESFFF